MSKKVLLKILIAYMVINCFLYPIVEWAVYIRIVLFAIIGVLAGIHIMQNKDTMYSDKIIPCGGFVIKTIVMLFLLMVYGAYGMDHDFWYLYHTVYQIFFEATIESFETFPVVIVYFYESFINSFALLSYIISYFCCGLTVFILTKKIRVRKSKKPLTII